MKHKKSKINVLEVIKKIKEIKKNGQSTSREFLKNNFEIFPYCTSTVEKLFGSWNNFLDLSEITNNVKKIPIRERLKTYRQACLKKGKFLSFYDLEKEGITSSQLKNLFNNNKPYNHLKNDLKIYLLSDDLTFSEWLENNFPKTKNLEKTTLLKKVISPSELGKYYNTFYGDSDRILRERWENLIEKGFPYPILEDEKWDTRFNNLIKEESDEFNHKETTSSMCNIFYPQMYDHLLKTFYKKEELIKNRIKYADRVTSGSLLTGLKLMTNETRTNFSPLLTKITLNKLTKNKPCNILDYSMGFGGRLLGTMATKEEHHYFGIEPWLKNIQSSKKMMDAVERNREGSSERVHTFNCGSEDYIPSLEGKIDVAFSSPPYFNYERYVNEKTQSYIKFPNYQDWLEKYWRETVKNIYKYLNNMGTFALNIKDVKKHNLERDMCNIVFEEGFYLEETMKYTLCGRMSNFNKVKTEPIFIFKKRD